jgi:hypothetical protein
MVFYWNEAPANNLTKISTFSQFKHLGIIFEYKARSSNISKFITYLPYYKAHGAILKYKARGGVNNK